MSVQTDPQHNDATDTAQNEPPPRNLSWLTVWRSVASAAFGVQSGENQKRDFQQTSPGRFILAGIGVSVIFVLGLVAIVSLVVS
jgi:hypothetical protein